MTREDYLKSLLTDIFTTKNTIDGILSMFETDAQRNILIEEIENGLREKRTIILLACDIADGLEV